MRAEGRWREMPIASYVRQVRHFLRAAPQKVSDGASVETQQGVINCNKIERRLIASKN